MNAQHIINKIGNRIGRINRRRMEIQADITDEINHAEKMKRVPSTGHLIAQINRLDMRLTELKP